MQALIVLNRWIARWLKIVMVAMTLVMLSALAAQVCMRYFFGIALSWTEELSLTLFAWTVLLASAYGVRQGTHVRMTVLLDRLDGRLRQAAERLIHLVTMFAGGYLCYAGWIYLVESDGMTSAAIGFALEYLYAAGPVTGGLIALFALEHALAASPMLVERSDHV